MLRAFKAAVVIIIIVVVVMIVVRVAILNRIYIALNHYLTEDLRLDQELARGVAILGAGIVALIPLSAVLLIRGKGAQFLILAVWSVAVIANWYTNRFNLFDPSGRPIRYIDLTSTGLLVSDRPGLDRLTGKEFKAVDQETAPLVEFWIKTGGVPTLQTEPCNPPFSAVSGEALCWYEAEGNMISYSRIPGFSPKDGQKLAPVTGEIIHKRELQKAADRAHADILASSAFKHLHIDLVEPPREAMQTSPSEGDGQTHLLPVGTRIPVKFAFDQVVKRNEEDIVTLGVQQTTGVWPGQRILLLVLGDMTASKGLIAIRQGSAAEGFVMVEADPYDRNHLLVSIVALRLYVPGKKRPLRFQGHLSANCPLPIARGELSQLVLDAPFEF